MNWRMIFGAIVGAGAIAGVAIAFVGSRATSREAAAQTAAEAQHEELVARISQLESQVDFATRRAAEAEQDREDLAKVLEAVRKSQPSLERRSEPANPKPAATGTVLPRGIAGIVNGRQFVRREVEASGQTQIALFYAGTDVELSAEDKEQLAQERAYQQDLAKRRMQEAKRRTEFQQAAVLDWATERSDFNTLLAGAEQLSAMGDFQGAKQLLDRALKEKPAGAPWSESAAALQSKLEEQRGAVDVPVISDGQTYVAIVGGDKFLGRIQSVVAHVPPGDYDVIGRRAGFRDVVIKLSVRSGMTPPPPTVICTERVE